MVFPRLLIALLLVPVLTAGEAVVLTIRGEALSGTPSWTPGGLILGQRTLPWSDIAAAGFPPAAAARIDRGVVTTSGEILRGEPLSTDHGSLLFASDFSGRQELPTAALAALVLSPQDLPGLRETISGAPGARLANRDRIDGSLAWLDADAAGIDTGQRTMPVPRGRISTVVLAAIAPAPGIWCRLASGERILASSLRGGDGGLMAVTARGELSLPAAAVAAIWRQELDLSAVVPTRIGAVDSLGAALPVELDAGLVLPARGEAAWPCAGGRAFAVWVEVPAGNRSAHASVVIDGTVAWQAALSPGAPPLLVALPITGREIILRSDPGADGETGGCAVAWRHPVLVR